jgi:hypothetical protein
MEAFTLTIPEKSHPLNDKIISCSKGEHLKLPLNEGS